MPLRQKDVVQIFSIAETEYLRLAPHLQSLDAAVLANISTFFEFTTHHPEQVALRLAELESAVDRFNTAHAAGETLFTPTYNSHTISHMIGEGNRLPNTIELLNSNIVRQVTRSFLRFIEKREYRFPETVTEMGQFATCVVLDGAGPGFLSYFKQDRAIMSRIRAHAVQDKFTVRDRITNAMIESASPRSLIFQDAKDMNWISKDWGFDPALVNLLR